MVTNSKSITPLLLGLALFGAATPVLAGSPQASVEGSLDKAAIREVVRANIDDVRECYTIELREDEDTTLVDDDGRVAFVIATDGHVREVEIASSSMPARFDACVAAAVERWTFPSATDETSVTYPFALAPG